MVSLSRQHTARESSGTCLHRAQWHDYALPRQLEIYRKPLRQGHLFTHDGTNGVCVIEAPLQHSTVGTMMVGRQLPSLKLRLSIPNFVSQVWRNPRLRDKIQTESLGSRLIATSLSAVSHHMMIDRSQLQQAQPPSHDFRGGNKSLKQTTWSGFTIWLARLPLSVLIVTGCQEAVASVILPSSMLHQIFCGSQINLALEIGCFAIDELQCLPYATA